MGSTSNFTLPEARVMMNISSFSRPYCHQIATQFIPSQNHKHVLKNLWVLRCDLLLIASKKMRCQYSAKRITPKRHPGTLTHIRNLIYNLISRSPNGSSVSMVYRGISDSSGVNHQKSSQECKLGNDSNSYLPLMIPSWTQC